MDSLLREGRAIQGQLPAAHKLDHDETSARKGFVRLMLQGNVKGALKCLQGLSTGGVLDLNAELANGNTVLRELPEKHPDAAPAGPNTLLFGPVNLVDPVIFQSIDAELVRTICLQTTGAAGVSGLDSSAWRRICCSFGSASSTLCQAIARLTRLLATTRVDSDGISALLAGRLIPLDKNPRVRSIGVGEVLRRIIAKLILRVTKHRIQECAGSLQLCAGQEAGIEAAVHALRKVFVDDATDGLLLVDAFNAFNSINREALLHNINVLCPALSTVVKNFYSVPSYLYVSGSKIESKEGTTQGDPLAMPIYALAVMPIILRLANSASIQQETMQVWYADDAGAGG